MSDFDYMRCIIGKSEIYANKNETSNYSVFIGNHVSATKILCHKAILIENSGFFDHCINDKPIDANASSFERPAIERWPTISRITADNIQLYGVRADHSISRLVTDSIQLNGVRVDTFEVMLAHMYGCKLDISVLNCEKLIRLLETSHRFWLPHNPLVLSTNEDSSQCLLDLATNVGHCLQSYMNCENILYLTELSLRYNLIRLMKICEKFIVANCYDLLLSSNFLSRLTEEQLIFILCDDLGSDLYINEIDVYNAVIQWTSTQCNLTEVKRRELLKKCVRYELMSEKQINEHVINSGNYTLNQYIVDNKVNGRNRQRKRRIVDTNFVNETDTRICRISKFGEPVWSYTEQLRHITPQALLNQNHYKKLSFFPHLQNRIESNSDDKNCIRLDFGKVRLINNINIHLFDNCIETVDDSFSFSYYIETSTHEHRDYYRVVDHSGYRCRSKQSIYFYARRVRYIRVVGLTTYVDLNPDHNDPYLYIRSLSCQLTSNRFDISRGFWTPVDRITSTECGCCLNVGLNEPNNGQRDDWVLKPTPQRNGYTYHEMARNIKLWKKKYIMIQLPQPIFCNSLALTVLNEGNYRYRICFARCDPETDFREPIRDEEIKARHSIDIMFDYTCMQFIKINGYQQNTERFKFSQLISPQTKQKII